MMGSNVNSPWTEARTADLVRLWSHGYSCAQIGAILGMSRNAVIGKSHRLQLPPHTNNVNSQKRMIDPLPPETPRTPTQNRRPQTIFKSRERKPRARVINPNATPALVPIVSNITGNFVNMMKRKHPYIRAMTKDEMRAMLTTAVQNTAAMQSELAYPLQGMET